MSATPISTDRHPTAIVETLPRPAGGSIVCGVHYYAVRAFFEDTDLTGVVYHANYLRWFERARSDLLRVLDIDQRLAHERGEGAYAVADLAIRYVSPARLDDDVLIETRAVQIGHASCRLRQTARRIGATGGNELAETLTLAEMPMLAQMDVRVGFITPDGRPRRQPDGWYDAFRMLAAADDGGAPDPSFDQTSDRKA